MSSGYKASPRLFTDYAFRDYGTHIEVTRVKNRRDAY